MWYYRITMLHSCKLVADIALFHNNKVLLVRYTNTNKYDHQQGWFLPDDYVQRFEHPEKAAQRILHHQIGIEAQTAKNIRLSHIESLKGNDRTWHLVFHFELKLRDKITLQSSQDIAQTKWFGIKSLPNRSEVAHHGWALTTLSRMNSV